MTARDVLSGRAAPPDATASAECAAGPAPAPARAGSEAAGAPAGGRGGPLSVRQRFRLGAKVDVNTAGWVEISGLPGISDPVARAVVARRTRGGPFRRAEDLLRVPGIKERRLKKILPFLSEFPNN